ncbi:MAG: hypothetical protein ISQ08_11255 [Planctomycetes bacterium]|nr:hypothetical protein [Planctomycetota bacterium]
MRLLQHVLLTTAVLQSLASAQWSTDPVANRAVVENPSDQNQPKLAATAGGGAWLAWMDGIGSGWDIRVQRLDALGVEAFAHDGLLVEDRALSSTQDYGLSVAPNGDALLAYRDAAGVGVVAQRVTPTGGLAWGTGVVLSTGSSVAPAIAGTTDGGAVVAWGEGSGVRVQKLDASGAAQWGAGITLSPTAGAYFPADVQPSGTGAIVSLVHQTGGFTSPKHLRAQRFDGAGVPQWGATPLAVFDQGSLQFGNFPDFLPDGAGGAVFAWYSSTPSLQCYAQRISVGGAELWPHNGVSLASNGSQIRVAPHAAFDAATGETFVFWTELNSTQSQRGIGGQRLDAAGNRLWGPTGATVVPLGSGDAGMARALAGGPTGGAWAVWAEIPAFGQDRLQKAHVNDTGVVDLGPEPLAALPSGKSRLAVARPLAGGSLALCVWSDDRTDGGDLYGQNLTPDGGLGNPVGAKLCGPGVPNSTGLSGELAGTGSAAVAANDLVLRATHLPMGEFAYALASQAPGFVMAPPGSQGNLCLGGPIARLVAQVGAVSGGTFQVAVDLTAIPMTPAQAVAPGETWTFQVWHRDHNPGPTSNFTDALAVTFQ